ncbi:MAG TPA: retroviral-like aspartic protease family protein [Burkholderiales bacterium]
MRALLALLLCTLATAAYPASSCKLARIAEWAVNGKSNRLIIDGAINGQKAGVLLDTGARYSFIHRAAADRLGLTRQEARGYRAAGVGGETYVEYAVVDELKIGNATRKNWRVFVLGERDLGAPYAFLLGHDFFEQADIEFDLANNAVRLFQPQDCSDVPLAYWSRTGVSEVKLETDHERPGILFKVSLNGTPLIANLDSGSSTSVVSRLVAANLGVTPEARDSYAIGKSGGIGASRVDAWIGAFESFAIGDETIRNPNIRFTNLEVLQTHTGSRLADRRELREMLLGLDFLRSHRVLIAHSQGKVYFTYVGGRVFAPPRP